MTIIPFLENNGAFEPGDIQAMSMALEDVCKALNIPADATTGRETIAARIIELARLGEQSPTRMRDRILEEARNRRDG